MAKDPICGMTVDEATALHAERDGGDVLLLQRALLKKVSVNTHHREAREKPQGKTIYTCPMHPEVQQDHPGNCPKCGMVLEPKTAAAGSDDEENAELRDMTERFWIGATLALPVFVLAMAHLIPAIGHDSWVTSDASRWIQFALTVARGLLGGLAFLPARLALHRDTSLEYVHADRHRRGRGLRL